MRRGCEQRPGRAHPRLPCARRPPALPAPSPVRTGTLSREEFQASLGSGAGPFHSMLGTTHLSLAASPLETGGRDPDLGASAYASGGSASAAAMPSDEQLALLAPRSGKRLDVDRFCLSLAYPVSVCSRCQSCGAVRLRRAPHLLPARALQLTRARLPLNHAPRLHNPAPSSRRQRSALASPSPRATAGRSRRRCCRGASCATCRMPSCASGSRGSTPVRLWWARG